MPSAARIVSTATTLAQIVGIGLICWLADTATRALGLPIPGPVVGFFALLGALAFCRVPTRAFQTGSETLISHLALFFVPPMLALSEHSELLSVTGLRIMTAVIVGTVVVMGGTALAVEFYLKREARRAG